MSSLEKKLFSVITELLLTCASLFLLLRYSKSFNEKTDIELHVHDLAAMSYELNSL